MDLVVTAFCYWIWNLFFPKKQYRSDDLDDSAAYFFSHPDLDGNRDSVNSDYDSGPEW